MLAALVPDVQVYPCIRQTTIPFCVACKRGLQQKVNDLYEKKCSQLVFSLQLSGGSHIAIFWISLETSGITIYQSVSKYRNKTEKNGATESYYLPTKNSQEPTRSFLINISYVKLLKTMAPMILRPVCQFTECLVKKLPRFYSPSIFFSFSCRYF